MNRPAQDSYSTPETTPTVLVVEDEPAIREVVADLLQDEGYAVRQASDGLQAIDELEVDDSIWCSPMCGCRASMVPLWHAGSAGTAMPYPLS